MKIQAKSSKELNKALKKASTCLQSKSALPFLNNVLLTIGDDGQLYFTSSTGDAELTFPAPLLLVEGDFKSPVAVPPARLIPFLATLPDCALTFSFDEVSPVFTIQYCTSEGQNTKEGEVMLPYFDGTDYPHLLSVQGERTKISIPMPILSEVAGQVDKFVGDNLRPVLSCLCIDVVEDLSVVNFVGTDGNRLYKRCLTNDASRGGFDFFRMGKPCQMLLQIPNLRTLSAFEGCEIIDIECDGRTIHFSSGDTSFTCKMIDGRYPNYNVAIPSNAPFFICVDKEELLSVIKRVSLFSNKNANVVELEKDGMFLRVNSRDVDFNASAGDQAFITNATCDEHFHIGFNTQSLLASISAIPDDVVRIRLSDTSPAAVLVGDVPSCHTLTLCMPVRL